MTHTFETLLFGQVAWKSPNTSLYSVLVGCKLNLWNSWSGAMASQFCGILSIAEEKHFFFFFLNGSEISYSAVRQIISNLHLIYYKTLINLYIYSL